MAIAPLLQVRRMIRRHSSADVSIGYLLILIPGFVLWVAYGIVSAGLALVIPNVLACLVATTTVLCAFRLRDPATGSDALRLTPRRAGARSS